MVARDRDHLEVLEVLRQRVDAEHLPGLARGRVVTGVDQHLRAYHLRHLRAERVHPDVVVPVRDEQRDGLPRVRLVDPAADPDDPVAELPVEVG